MMFCLEIIRLNTEGIVHKHWAQVGKFVSHGVVWVNSETALHVCGS